MKFILFILSFIFINHLSAQNTLPKNYSKEELDTSFFDRRLCEKYFWEDDFGQSDIFKINNKYRSILHEVAVYNSYIGKAVSNLAIKPKFNFDSANHIKSVAYYLNNKKINITWGAKTGFNIFLMPAHDGEYSYIELAEYRNYHLNGLSCKYTLLNDNDTILVEKEYFINDKPSGRYCQYYPNGKLKEEGDSLFAFNPKTIKQPYYNIFGNIERYVYRKNYDTKKKGTWKYYNEKGELIKEEYYK